MSDEKAVFWSRFFGAVRAEARPTSSIVGASGLNHPVLALGADDANKRLIVISSEYDARASAMMQIDIQSTLPGVHVVVARPIAVGLPVIAQRATEIFGSPKIKLEKLATLIQTDEGKKELTERVLSSAVKSFDLVPLDILSQVLYIIKQLTYLELEKIANTAGEVVFSGDVDLSNLAAQDLTQVDREVGVCPLPLYAFEEDDWNAFESSSSEVIAEHLKRLGIFQYFFPPPDHAALGLIDRFHPPKDSINSNLQLLPKMGHPMGDTELVTPTSSVLTMVNELQSKGLIVEGRAEFALTETGREVRASVQFKPRESVLSKLINQIRLKVNINNYFR